MENRRKIWEPLSNWIIRSIRIAKDCSRKLNFMKSILKPILNLIFSINAKAFELKFQKDKFKSRLGANCFGCPWTIIWVAARAIWFLFGEEKQSRNTNLRLYSLSPGRLHNPIKVVFARTVSYRGKVRVLKKEPDETHSSWFNDLTSSTQ